MNGYAWGGSEELWSRTALLAAREGHEVLAAVHLRREPRPKFFDELAKQSGRFFYVAKPDPMPTRYYVRWLRKLRLANTPPQRGRFTDVIDFKPDVLLVSLGGPANPATLPELAAFLQDCRCPVALLVQHAKDTPDPGVLLHRDLLREVYVAARHVFFVAHRNASSLEDWLGTDLPHTVVRNPVNLATHNCLPMPDANSPLQLASVARLDCSDKGQDLMIDVLSQAQWRDRDISLTMYGAGSQKKFIEGLIARRRLSDRIRLAGHCDNIVALWTRHHALLMASRAEGTPLALVEAMLCGRPAIVTDVGGMSEWITDGESGFVAEAPYISSLGRALERLWSSRDRLGEMGLRARQVALRQFDPNPGRTMLDALIDIADISSAASTKILVGSTT